MAFYTVRLVDHGENVWHVENIECHSDDEAITEAKRSSAFGFLGAGFDLYLGDALIHRHRRQLRE